MSAPIRRAIVKGDYEKIFKDVDLIKRYLPDNYRVSLTWEWVIRIEGHDVAGWTLDDYVIPRLASGLIVAQEVIYADGDDEVFEALSGDMGTSYWLDEKGDILVPRKVVDR